MCHLVLLFPVFGLALFWILPLPVAAVLYAIVLAMSIWMYKLIMSAMARPIATGSEGLVGELGEVIGPSGRFTQLMVHGEVWQGTSSVELEKGQSVRVTGVDRLLLQIEDASAPSSCRDRGCHRGSPFPLFHRHKPA